MASNATVSTLSAALKTLYPQSKINEEFFIESPFMGMVPKSTDFTGNNLVLAVRYAGQQGRGTTIAQAQTARTATQQVAFTLTRKKDYAVGRITGEAIKAAKGTEGSLVDGLQSEMDSCLTTLKRSLAQAVWGNSGGFIGTVGSLSTTVLTLANREDAINFFPGQIIVASATDGSSGAGSLRDSGDSVTVLSVDPDAGTVTGSAAWSTQISGLVAGDYLFIQGDFGAKLTGIRGWVPTSAPSASENFFGVDRSVHPTALAGIRYAASAGAAIEETLQTALARAYVYGSRPDVIFLNPANYNHVVLALGTRVIFDKSKAFNMPEIGFESFVIVGPAGRTKVVADPYCPLGYAYALTMKTWKLYSLGPAPHMLEDDGLSMLRVSDSDDYEWRLGYYAQLGCSSPGENMVITL